MIFSWLLLLPRWVYQLAAVVVLAACAFAWHVRLLNEAVQAERVVLSAECEARFAQAAKLQQQQVAKAAADYQASQAKQEADYQDRLREVIKYAQTPTAKDADCGGGARVGSDFVRLYNGAASAANPKH